MLMYPQPVSITMILHDVIKEGLQVEKDSQSFLWDVLYVVELLKTIFIDIVRHVYGKTFVEMRDVAGFTRHQVQSQQVIPNFSLEILQGRIFLHHAILQ